MNITLLNVEVSTKPTKTPGRSYQEANVAYKNNSFGGKVEGKKLLSFGAQAEVFKALVAAQSGQSFEIEVEKNSAGYNDWVKIQPADVVAAPMSGKPKEGLIAGPTIPSTRPTYETPEERAQKQVYIIRQSSFGTAAGLMASGAKSAPKFEEVLEYAKKIEDYVLGKPSQGKSGVEDFPIFEPDEEFPQVN